MQAEPELVPQLAIELKGHIFELAIDRKGSLLLEKIIIKAEKDLR